MVARSETETMNNETKTAEALEEVRPLAGDNPAAAPGPPPAPLAAAPTPPGPEPESPPAAPPPPPAPTPTREEWEALQGQAAKAAEHWDRYVRAVADLENFKKRAARERQEATRFANESLLTRLVPVLDSFDMALAATGNAQGATLESLKTGIQMIQGQLKAVLTEAGLEEIDATGKPFDPNWHEAVSQEESADLPEGHVGRQLRKGYRFRERLLRPAGVVVAKKPAA